MSGLPGARQCSANHYFTFSNAQKSEKVVAKSQPAAALILTQRPTPHFFTFSPLPGGPYYTDFA
jgi:hypothetical protein